MRLLDPQTLGQSDVVANSTMNRQRELADGNSYARELRTDLGTRLEARLCETGRVRWLDLCCGTGRALVQAGAKPTGEVNGFNSTHHEAIFRCNAC